MLKVYNPGPCSFILVRNDIGLPDLRIPVRQERETETCRDLEKMVGIGRLQIRNQQAAAPAQKPAQSAAIQPVNPDEMRPIFHTQSGNEAAASGKLKLCIATAASTGKPCQNYAEEGSDYCRMHRKKFEKKER